MQLIDVHTPSSSFSLPHSRKEYTGPVNPHIVITLFPVQQDNLQTLFDKLSRKVNTTADGKRVGPGWLKYHHGDSFWNLDDGKKASRFPIGIH